MEKTVSEAIKHRRSVRKFDPSKELNSNIVKKCIETGFIIDNLTRDVLNSEKSEISEAENQLASFQEQLFFYVFGFLAAMGKDDPKEMLKVVYSVLADKKDDIERLFFPIVSSSVASIEQEFRYQMDKDQQKSLVKSEEPKSEEPKVEPKKTDELYPCARDRSVDSWLLFPCARDRSVDTLPFKLAWL